MCIRDRAWGIAYSSVESGINNYAKPYFTEAYPNALAASTTIAIVGIGMVVSRLLASKIHKKKAEIAAACCLGGGLMALLMVLVPGAWSSYLWCILFGLIAGPAWPLAMSVAIDSFPENPGRISTLLLVGSSTGAVSYTHLGNMQVLGRPNLVLADFRCVYLFAARQRREGFQQKFRGQPLAALAMRLSF